MADSNPLEETKAWLRGFINSHKDLDTKVSPDTIDQAIRRLHQCEIHDFKAKGNHAEFLEKYSLQNIRHTFELFTKSDFVIDDCLKKARRTEPDRGKYSIEKGFAKKHLPLREPSADGWNPESDAVKFFMRSSPTTAYQVMRGRRFPFTDNKDTINFLRYIKQKMSNDIPGMKEWCYERHLELQRQLAVLYIV